MYRILIVEDEELERTSMKIFLEENLPDVEIVGEAKSGYEAVELIGNCDINLILVDINIPGIDGMEVIKYARKKLPQAVMIFLAPPSLAELRRRLESRGDTPPDKIEARLKQARWEIQQACHYTYLVLNNRVETCVAQVEAILQQSPEAEACRPENQTDLEILKEVLSHVVSPHV